MRNDDLALSHCGGTMSRAVFGHTCQCLWVFLKVSHRELPAQHREVLCGLKPISIESVALPESQELYARRHNEELARRVQRDQLAAEFEAACRMARHPFKKKHRDGMSTRFGQHV